MHLWVTFLIEHIKFIRCIIFQPVSSWSIAGIFCVRTQAAFLVMSVICELRCVMFNFESVIRLRVTCGCLCCCGLVYRLLFFFYMALLHNENLLSQIWKDWLHPHFDLQMWILSLNTYTKYLNSKKVLKRLETDLSLAFGQKAISLIHTGFPKKGINILKAGLAGCWVTWLWHHWPVNSQQILLCHFLPRTLTSALKTMRTSLW